MELSPIICMEALLSSPELAIMLTWIAASTVASNSRVLAPDMVKELQEAFHAPDTKAIYSVIQKVYLVGQDRNHVLHEVFERACTLHDTGILHRILDLDYESVPAVQPIRVNSLWPEAIRLSLVDNCACVLRCFLRNGLDPHQRYDDEGDVLMWAVRGRDSDTVMNLLRMGCDAEGVKVRQYFGRSRWKIRSGHSPERNLK